MLCIMPCGAQLMWERLPTSPTCAVNGGRRSCRVSPSRPAGGVEDSIEKRHRQFWHERVEPALPQVMSNVGDERDESLSAIDREANHADGCTSRKYGADKLFG